jgi:2-dehydropantoate 2-reductase
MRIAILGAGALGTIFGALMTKKGVPVVLIDVNKAHVDALNRNGAKIVGAMEFTQPVTAITPEQMSGEYDLVFVLTKLTASAQALPGLKKFLHKDSIVCTLQNGMPEEIVESYIGGHRTVGGAVAPTGALLEPGVVQANSTEEIMSQFAFEIGEMDGSITPRLETVKKYLSAVGNVDILDNLRGVRWSKIKINSTGAGMSSALGTTFGENIDDPKILICMAFIADEVVRVAEAQNVKLVKMQGFDIAGFKLSGPEDIQRVVPMFRTIWNRHRSARGSMMFDLQRGFDTEIDHLNGLVTKKGREWGIPTPFKDKVVELIKEAQSRRGVNDYSKIKEFEPLIARYAGGIQVEIL